MKKILICAFVAASCSSNKKENAYEQHQRSDSTTAPTEIKSKTNAAVQAMDFPLDSLLQFDSMTELKEVFGDENVIQSKGYLPEGMGTYPNTLLYPTAKNEVEFQWKDTIHFKGLSHIHIAGTSCGWKTKQGITLGTTMKDLEKLNKRSFSFHGFGWDYSGTTSWDGGEMEKKRIGVNLGFPEGIFEEGLANDQEFKSSSELAQKVNPVVVELRIIR